MFDQFEYSRCMIINRHDGRTVHFISEGKPYRNGHAVANNTNLTSYADAVIYSARTVWHLRPNSTYAYETLATVDRDKSIARDIMMCITTQYHWRPPTFGQVWERDNLRGKMQRMIWPSNGIT